MIEERLLGHRQKSKSITAMKLINTDPDLAFHEVISEANHKFSVPVAYLLCTKYVNICRHTDDFEGIPFVAALYPSEDETFLGYVIVHEGPANIRKYTIVPEGYRPRVEWLYDGEQYVGVEAQTEDGTFRPVFVNEKGLTWREGEVTHEQELAACHEVGRRYTETGDASVFHTLDDYGSVKWKEGK